MVIFTDAEFIQKPIYAQNKNQKYDSLCDDKLEESDVKEREDPSVHKKCLRHEMEFFTEQHLYK